MVFGSGNKFRIRRTTSKASYLASYRRDRDRGLPNFEGSYKRIMSPTGQEVLVDNPSNSVPECDRLSIPAEAPSIPVEEKSSELLHPAASQHQAVNTTTERVSPSQQEPNNTRTKEDVVVLVDRLVDSEAKCGDSSEQSGSATSCVVPLSVEIETQCDLVTEPTTTTTTVAAVTTIREEIICEVAPEDSPPQSPPPSPPAASPPPSPPARRSSPPPPSSATMSLPPPPPARMSPKVTESLQLVQRSEVVLRVNAATSDASSQTEVEKEGGGGAAPAALLVRPKLQEEIECERLSLDLASQLPPSDKLQTLLVPDPEHKKPTDYVSGLFRLDVALRPRPAATFRTQGSSSNGGNSTTSVPSSQTPSEDAAKDNNANSPVSPLPANSKYFTISESKAKFLNRYVRDMSQLNGLHDNKDLHQKKEELMSRLARKLEVLRGEQLVVTEEAAVNEQLGESVAAHVSRLARPHELGKYRLHVEEVGKITSLLLGLSGRLARAENALMGLPLHHSERKILESKRDKLREQLEEAKKLKENIDRRSVSVSNILYKYFNSEEYADYDHFINMKAKLIMDSREIADKIKLGEEQLAALKETLCSSGGPD